MATHHQGDSEKGGVHNALATPILYAGLQDWGRSLALTTGDSAHIQRLSGQKFTHSQCTQRRERAWRPRSDARAYGARTPCSDITLYSYWLMQSFPS